MQQDARSGKVCSELKVGEFIQNVLTLDDADNRASPFIAMSTFSPLTGKPSEPTAGGRLVKFRLSRP